MGEHVIRQTPKGMPSAERVARFTEGLPKPFLVFGSRADSTRANRTPDFQTHGTYRIATGNLNDLEDKHVICFLHGYNVTTDSALSSARGFFRLLHESLERDNRDTTQFTYLLFTWPGDTGTIYFDDAQAYAHHSGVALYNLLVDSQVTPPRSIVFVTHSLGAHVALRGLSVLGERLVRQRVNFRVERVLLLGPAVEDDVFSRPNRAEEYHFPEAAFGMRGLHIVSSRSDNVLGGAFRVNEDDLALGFSGPETMDTLVSLSRRVEAVLGRNETFVFELHDFSNNSATIMNPALWVRGHGDYWQTQAQTDYYVNLIG